MTPTPPLISVIVAVHNVAGHVGACLKSLVAQELADFEALVIDDGSTDDSRAEAEAAVAGDARFRILSFANGGLSAARNRGLALAQGAFIAFVDGDDRVEPGYLSRMYDALMADGGDWVACGLRFAAPDGAVGPPHPAMHGTPPTTDVPERHDFSDLREVARHYPSAWNKLYRRELIGDLTFDEGTYYEDHGFFWQLARRTRHLLRLPDALYIQTQGRDGQITRDGSDRVFEQFTVLDRLRQIMLGSGRAGADLAFARLASRLIFERSAAIADPARRARFAATATGFLARHNIAWSPEWDPGIGRGLGLTLTGRLPLTVVIPSDGQPAALTATLEALAAQGLRDFETLIVTADEPARKTALHAAATLPGASVLAASLLPGAVPDPDMSHRTALARNRGLMAAQGVFVIFLDAGDRPHPGALGQGLDAMLRHGPDEGSDMGFFPFLPGPGAPAHSGLHDMAGMADRLIPGPFALDGEGALRLHPHPSAKIFRSAFLAEQSLFFAHHALQSWQFTLEAALLARSVVHVPIPAVTLDPAPDSRRFWRAPHTAADLARALDAVIAATQSAATQGGHRLPDGWQRRLFARAIWEKVNFAAFPDPQAAETFALQARAELGLRHLSGPVPDGILDPYIGPRIRAILEG